TATDVLRQAEDFGQKPDLVDLNASLRSQAGLVIMRPLILTSSKKRITEKKWPHVYNRTSPKTAYSDPPPDQDVCYGQEYDQTYHDYCACLLDPFECPGVEDTLPCGPSDDCGGSSPPDDRDETEEDEEERSDFAIKGENDVTVERYKSYDVAIAEPSIRTEAVGSVVDETLTEIDVYLTINAKEFLPLPNGDVVENEVVSWGGWFDDETSVGYITRYQKTGLSENVRLWFFASHAGRYKRTMMFSPRETVIQYTRSWADL
ncbi:hypothetical protein, partial [Longibacter sp.]|uniref:hypothetical protein n=1 Tax=Longibacter sp. TaxID=2045415 RepID=UPI003EBD1493